MRVRQTACRLCGQDIEGISPFPKGEWRDRGNNTHCNDGQVHAPVVPDETTTFQRLAVGETFEFAYGGGPAGKAAGFAQGPWKKISARRYEKPGMVCSVGTIKVFVRPLLGE